MYTRLILRGEIFNVCGFLPIILAKKNFQTFPEDYNGINQVKWHFPGLFLARHEKIQLILYITFDLTTFVNFKVSKLCT